MRSLLLALAGIAVGVVAAEVVTTWMLGPPRTAHPLLFFSAPNWEREPGAEWLRYAPHAEIRSVAIYGGLVAYDARFRTNDLGFVDERDYRVASDAPESRRYAFVGDSFTAGFHGGAPWVQALRARAETSGGPLEIYNLGVGGTGFRQFLPLLAHVGERLEFGHVVFLFIGDDLSRILWKPVVAGDRLVTCPLAEKAARCAGRRTWMRILADPDAPADALLRRAAEVRAAGAPGPDGWLRRHSHLRALWPSTAAGQLAARRKDVDLAAWLDGLPAVLGPRSATFLHIPERHEVAAGAYDSDLGAPIRAAGHRYVPLLEACGFDEGHYLEVDPHFDAEGYAELGSCVGRVLGLLPSDA